MISSVCIYDTFMLRTITESRIVPSSCTGVSPNIPRKLSLKKVVPNKTSKDKDKDGNEASSRVYVMREPLVVFDSNPLALTLIVNLAQTITI